MLFWDAVDWQGASVLDVGCHAGWFLYAAHLAGASKLIGVDLNGFHDCRIARPDVEPPLERAAHRLEGLNVELIAGDWLELKRRPRADVAMCLNALHYMADRDRAVRLIFESARRNVVLERKRRPVVAPAPWRLVLEADSEWNSRRIEVYEHP